MACQLILLRHGQSKWNQENLFTGWVDIPLSEAGIEECFLAGEQLQNIPMDVIFTSSLIRAQMTIPLALLKHKSQKTPVFLHPEERKLSKWEKVHSEMAKKELIPVYQSWRLNERMYGDLQGLNKKETSQKYGEEQVHAWRRGFDIQPPGGESLKMTARRTLPYFKKKIVPFLQNGKSVLIAAHGNSLRAIVMHIEAMSAEEIVSLELPTAKPRIYHYEDGKYVLSR